MRRSVVGLLSAVVVLQGCADRAPPDAVPSPSPQTLPCNETEQGGVILDIAGPGRPTPEEAVAPYAGALKLVAQESDGETTVIGLRPDKTVFRVFDVTEHADGWWPDGYRECVNLPRRHGERLFR